MSRFVKEINDLPLAAERAEKDILGNKIDTTYQHKLTAGSNISINEVTNTISAQVPPDFSSVIPSDATSSNKLVTTNTLDTRLADFGGFKEVQGTGADLHPNVPSGEEDSKLIYLVRDDSATGDDKYKEWIWDSGDPEADPPVAAQWKLIGDTTMNLEGKADKVQNATSGNLAALDSSGNLMDSGVDPSQLDGNLKQGLQGFQGTQIPANSDLNTYTAPGNYYIASDPDMREIFHTPFAQMGFTSSETGKTGASQVTVYNMNGTASARVMQVMYTMYSPNPTGDNAFGFWYRMSAGGSPQTWGDWHRMLQTNGYAPYRYGSTTPSTATKSAELLKVKVGKALTYISLTIAVTISAAASNQNMLVIATLSIRGNTPKIEAEVINRNLGSSIGRVRFYAQNDSNLVTTYGIMFPDKDNFTNANITYTVLDHSGWLYESKAFPSFNNVWLLYNPILSSSTPSYTVYTDLYNGNPDSIYFASSSMWTEDIAYAYVKSGITVTVTVDSLIENKTYTAQVVRTSSNSSQFSIKFQNSTAFNVYGHSQTKTNVTTFTLSHSLYPMLFMRSGSNIYILSY